MATRALPPKLGQHIESIVTLCQRHHVRKLDLFASAATGEFDPDRSDFDFVVTFGPGETEKRAEHYFGLLFGLEEVLGYPVDLVVESALENPYFIAEMNSSRLPVYG